MTEFVVANVATVGYRDTDCIGLAENLAPRAVVGPTSRREALVR